VMVQPAANARALDPGGTGWGAARAADLSLPLLIASNDILKTWLERLPRRLERAIAQSGYAAATRVVFLR